jgi:hypothetical protein
MRALFLCKFNENHLFLKKWRSGFFTAPTGEEHLERLCSFEKLKLYPLRCFTLQRSQLLRRKKLYRTYQLFLI